MRTLIALLLAPLATAGLVSLAAFFEQGRSLLDVVRRLTDQPLDVVSLNGVVLVLLGVAAGIPAALGLMPGGPLVLPGAIVACLVGRRLLSGRRDLRDVVWTAVLIWCIAAGLLRLKTVDPSQALAAQSALGPSLLLLPPIAIASSGLALIAGLASVLLWSRALSQSSSEGLTGSWSDVLSWGESTLGATAVTATMWGPSIGALVYGPFSSSSLWLWVVSSLAVTVGAIAAVCLSSKRLPREATLVRFLSAGVPVAAVLALAFAGTAS